MKRLYHFLLFIFAFQVAVPAQTLTNWKHYYSKNYYLNLDLGNAVAGGNSAELISVDKTTLQLSRIPYPAGIRKVSSINNCGALTFPGPGNTTILRNDCADTTHYLWDGLSWIPIFSYLGFNISDLSFLEYRNGSKFFTRTSNASLYQWDGSSLTVFDTVNSPYRPDYNSLLTAPNDDIFISYVSDVSIRHNGSWTNYNSAFFNLPYLNAYSSSAGPTGDFCFYNSYVDSALHIYHSNTASWSAHTLPLSMSHKVNLPNLYVFSILYDGFNNVWFCGDSIFCKFDGNNYIDKFGSTAAAGIPFAFPVLSAAANGNLFIRVDKDQYYFNTTTDSFTPITDSMAILPSNFILPSLKDVNGNIWFGTTEWPGKNALIKYHSGTWKMIPLVYPGFSQRVLTIKQDTGQSLIIGGGDLFSDGPMLLTNDSVLTLVDSSGYAYKTVQAIAIDNNHHYWFGGGGSGVPEDLCEYGTSLVQHHNNLFNSHEDVLALDIDSLGNKWVSYLDTNITGVFKFNSNFTAYNSGNSPMPAKQVLSIKRERSTNRMWFCTTGGGFISYRNGTWSAIDTSNSPLPSNYARYIYFADDSTTWFCTSAGFCSLKNGVWHSYSNYNSPLYSGICRSIIVDNDCTVWVTGWGGLSSAQISSCVAPGMAVSGNVYQVNNAAVPNANILVLKLNSAGTNTTVADQIFADYSGHFSYQAPDTGLYFFRAAASPVLYPGQITAYPDSALIIQQSAAVHVTATGNYSTDIHLRQTASSPGACLVKGQLISPTLQPIGSVRILLMLNNQPVASAITDGDGRFEFPDIDSTGYTLWVDKYGFDNSQAPPAPVQCVGTPVTDTFIISTNLLISGIQDHHPLAAEGLMIYPNPSTGFIHIDMGEAMQGSLVEVYSPEGRLLSRSMLAPGQHTLDLSALPKGMYLVRVSNSRVSLTRKIVLM